MLFTFEVCLQGYLPASHCNACATDTTASSFSLVTHGRAPAQQGCMVIQMAGDRPRRGHAWLQNSAPQLSNLPSSSTVPNNPVHKQCWAAQSMTGCCSRGVLPRRQTCIQHGTKPAQVPKNPIYRVTHVYRLNYNCTLSQSRTTPSIDPVQNSKPQTSLAAGPYLPSTYHS